MKKILLTVAALALMAVPAMAAAPSQLGAGIGGPNTQQYHSYDGLICTDCHTLHGSEDGAAVSAGAGAGNWAGFDDLTAGGGYRELLKKGDWTDMCLSCHKQGYNTAATADLPSVESVKYGNWVAPIVMTNDGITPANVAMPAGDFYYSNADPKKGHNPAFTKGANFAGAGTSKLMQADVTLKATPPGGAIADGEWSCHSCHGMHSRFSGGYTAYRQLKRKVNNLVVSTDVSGFGVETKAGDYTTGQLAAGFEPLKSNTRGDLQGAGNLQYVNLRKDGQALQGADLFLTESDTNKNVYQGGFSSFCSACHGNFHGGEAEKANSQTEATNGVTNVNNTWVKHPTNIEMAQTASNRKYGINTYKKAMTNVQGTSPNPAGYDFKYPLVKADADFSVKSTVASYSDAATLAGTDRIMCLTCHKAHATQYDNMVRWDANAHSFLPATEQDMTSINAGGEVNRIAGDNIAYGCGKCHQKGGTAAYVKTGF